MRIMIDIESWSTEGNASVRSIGAVDIDDPKVQFYQNINSNLSSWSYKYDFSQATQDWWAEQDQDVQDVLKDNKVAPHWACMKLQEWFIRIGFDPENKDHEIWACGVVFDIGVLEHMFRLENVEVPWSYGQVRDFRTVREFFEGDLREVGANLSKHDALADAQHQAEQLLYMENA